MIIARLSLLVGGLLLVSVLSSNNYDSGLNNKVIGGVYILTDSCLGSLLCRVSLSLNNNCNSGLGNKRVTELIYT